MNCVTEESALINSFSSHLYYIDPGANGAKEFNIILYKGPYAKEVPCLLIECLELVKHAQLVKVHA